MVKQESLNERDLSYSTWHRYQLPADWYATDIDMIELDKSGTPLMMQELKHGNLQELNLSSFLIRSHCKMADKLEIPYFITVYYSKEEFGDWLYYVVAVNKLAQDIFDKLGQKHRQVMTEQNYVRFLAYFRKEHVHDKVLEQYCNRKFYVRLPVLVGGEP